MKVMVKKVNINKVGMSVEEAFSKAREVASTIEHFRVRLWKAENDMPRTSWSWMGDDIADIRPIFNKDEYDVITVSDDDTGRTVETILVND